MNISKKFKSLKMRILVLTLGLCSAIGVISLFSLTYVIHKQEAGQANAFEGHARHLGDALAAQFFERYGDVQAFALNPDIQSTQNETAVNLLNSLAAMYGIYDLVLIIDSTGKLRAVNHLSPTGKPLKVEALYQENFSKQPWFQAALSGRFTEDKQKGFSGTYFEDIHIDPIVSKVYGENRLGTGFTAQLKNREGKVIGVISNRASSRWYEVALTEAYENLHNIGFAQAEITLISKQGVILSELAPSDASGSESKLKYDWERLLKTNLVSGGLQAARNSTSGKSGTTSERHLKTGILQFAGYTPVKGPKFVEEIGWSVLVRNSVDEVLQEAHRGRNIFYVIFTLAMLVAIGLSILTANKLITILSRVVSTLTEGSRGVSITVTQLSAASQDLASSSQQQAAALQETTAAVEEISAMVKRSAELAGRAEESMKGSREDAEKGNEIVTRVTQAMGAINESNGNIASQMTESNEKIGSIVRVIQEVGAKTKVINDIVFQTKLLSFNASVEAARAGEHGKGFAVVAEEVGNLAQMSGNAAKEINELLDQSLGRVRSIVDETKSKVDTMIASANDKVKEGMGIANKCSEVLQHIVESSVMAAEMVSNISQASKESSKGVEEISRALHQVDRATQVNASAARSCASSADNLATEVTSIRDSAAELNRVVSGTDLVSKFEWKDDYLLGVTDMDNEHKILVTKINALAEAIGGSSSELITRFQALAEFTIEHFSAEENFIESIEYPDVDIHKQIHANLLAKIGEFGEQVKSGTVNSSHLMTFLNDWLLRHILGVDMKYARYSRGERGKSETRLTSESSLSKRAA